MVLNWHGEAVQLRFEAEAGMMAERYKAPGGRVVAADKEAIEKEIRGRGLFTEERLTVKADVDDKTIHDILGQVTKDGWASLRSRFFRLLLFFSLHFLALSSFYEFGEMKLFFY